MEIDKCGGSLAYPNVSPAIPTQQEPQSAPAAGRERSITHRPRGSRV